MARLNFDNRLEILNADVERVQSNRDLKADAQDRKVKALRAAAEQEILGDLRFAFERAARGVDKAESDLARARVAALAPADVNRFMALRDVLSATLALAPDDATNGVTPLSRAAELVDLASKSGDRDVQHAAASAIAAQLPTMPSGFERAALAKRASEMATQPAEVGKAEQGVQAARHELELVLLSARRVSERVDPVGLRNALHAGQPSRFERAVAGDVVDVWGGVPNVTTAIPGGGHSDG